MDILKEMKKMNKHESQLTTLSNIVDSYYNQSGLGDRFKSYIPDMISEYAQEYDILNMDNESQKILWYQDKLTDDLNAFSKTPVFTTLLKKVDNEIQCTIYVLGTKVDTIAIDHIY